MGGQGDRAAARIAVAEPAPDPIEDAPRRIRQVEEHVLGRRRRLGLRRREPGLDLLAGALGLALDAGPLEDHVARLEGGVGDRVGDQRRACRRCAKQRVRARASSPQLDPAPRPARVTRRSSAEHEPVGGARGQSGRRAGAAPRARGRRSASRLADAVVRERAAHQLRGTPRRCRRPRRERAARTCAAARCSTARARPRRRPRGERIEELLDVGEQRRSSWRISASSPRKLLARARREAAPRGTRPGARCAPDSRRSRGARGAPRRAPPRRALAALVRGGARPRRAGRARRGVALGAARETAARAGRAAPEARAARRALALGILRPPGLDHEQHVARGDLLPRAHAHLLHDARDRAPRSRSPSSSPRAGRAAGRPSTRRRARRAIATTIAGVPARTWPAVCEPKRVGAPLDLDAQPDVRRRRRAGAAMRLADLRGARRGAPSSRSVAATARAVEVHAVAPGADRVDLEPILLAAVAEIDLLALGGRARARRERRGIGEEVEPRVRRARADRRGSRPRRRASRGVGRRVPGARWRRSDRASRCRRRPRRKSGGRRARRVR